MEKYRKDLLESIENEKYNQELFIKIAEDLIKKLELNEYVKKIHINENIKIGYDGTYNGTDINISLYKRKKKILIYYRELFCILFHELQHAKQNKLLDKYNDYYFNLPNDYVYDVDEIKELEKIYDISIDCEIVNTNMGVYSFKHDLFPTEHEANYYGFINSIDFLIKMVPEFKESIIKTNIYNYQVMNLLLYGYKFKRLSGKLISPFERILVKKMKKSINQNLFEDSYLTNHERMILGLPIEKDLFFKFYNDMVSDKFSTDIKEYILKIK